MKTTEKLHRTEENDIQGSAHICLRVQASKQAETHIEMHIRCGDLGVEVECGIFIGMRAGICILGETGFFVWVLLFTFLFHDLLCSLFFALHCYTPPHDTNTHIKQICLPIGQSLHAKMSRTQEYVYEFHDMMVRSS